MKNVLVDTSVWVDHFRNGNPLLVELLALDRVMSHPMILGEIACGTPPERNRTLRDIERLQQPRQATVRKQKQKGARLNYFLTDYFRASGF